MSFETNIRSIQVAADGNTVKEYGFTGTVALVAEGVEVKLVKNNQTIYKLVRWESLRHYRDPFPMGVMVVGDMILAEIELGDVS